MAKTQKELELELQLAEAEAEQAQAQVDVEQEGGSPEQQKPNVEEVQHPDISNSQRLLLKNLGSEQGIETELRKKFEDVINNDGRIAVRHTGEPSYKVLDPDTGMNLPTKALPSPYEIGSPTGPMPEAGGGAYDWSKVDPSELAKDVGDSAADLAPMLAQKFFGMFGVNPEPVTKSAATGISAALQGGYEGLRQGAGKLAGIENNISPKEIGTATAIGALAPWIFGTNPSKETLAKYAAKANIGVDDAVKATRGLLGMARDGIAWGAKKVPSVLSGIPTRVLETGSTMRPEIKALNNMPNKNEYLEGIIGGIKKDLHESRQSMQATKNSILDSIDREAAAKQANDIGDYITDKKTFLNQDLVDKEMTPQKIARMKAKAQYKDTAKLAASAADEIPYTGVVRRAEVVQPFNDLLTQLEREANELAEATSSNLPLQEFKAINNSVKRVIGKNKEAPDLLTMKAAETLRSNLKRQFNIFKKDGKLLPQSTDVLVKRIGSAAEQSRRIIAEQMDKGTGGITKEARDNWKQHMRAIDIVDEYMPQDTNLVAGSEKLISDPLKVEQISHLPKGKKIVDLAKKLEAYGYFGAPFQGMTTQNNIATRRVVSGGLGLGAASLLHNPALAVTTIPAALYMSTPTGALNTYSKSKFIEELLRKVPTPNMGTQSTLRNLMNNRENIKSPYLNMDTGE